MVLACVVLCCAYPVFCTGCAHSVCAAGFYMVSFAKHNAEHVTFVRVLQGSR